MTAAELDTLLALRGWCDREKATTLHALLGRHSASLGRPLAAAEVGVFGGRSLFAAALGLRDAPHGGFAVGVDPYSHAAALEQVVDEKDAQFWLGQVDLGVVLRECLAAREVLGLAPWCGLLLAPSQLTAGIVGTLDYLHIDGNHTPGVALRDVELYLPKVRPGGLVVVDDCDWDGVRPAWGRVAARGELLHRVRRGDHPGACDYAVYAARA